jgi:hypothetical protein
MTNHPTKEHRTMEDETERMPGDRFLAVLRDLRKGRTVSELEDKMREVVNRVRDTGKKGTLTLTISIDPTKAGDGTYQLSDKVVSKLPDFERHATLFFGTPDGNLQQEDPRQQPLPFNEARRIRDEQQTPRRV